MSPLWVKLGDFGVSKRILAQATTAFHTQVSTPVYSAPEVLGLDPNSETSNYTNSVDIWSLGCVIYELLVGTKLFVSEFQLCRYFYGTWAFPEESLRVLSPPTDDTGISLLRAMLAIPPGDRPTATGALRNQWLTGLKSGNEESGDELTIAENSLDTSMVTLSDTSPTEGLVVQTESGKSDIVSHNSQATHSKSLKRMRKKQIRNTPQTYHQSRTQNTTLTLLTKRVTNLN